MRGLIVHVTVYVVTNAVLVFAWLMTDGSTSELETYLDDPIDALTPTFWPIFPIVIWGAALIIHAVAVITGQFGSRRRRRRHKAARRRQHEHQRVQRYGQAHPRSSTGPVHRFVTVMFTDIADSTPLTETLGDPAWAETLAEHRALVRRHVDRNNGREVGTQGDGFLVQFDTPGEGVACAIDLQRALEKRRRKGAFSPQLRVGIHTGDALQNDEDLVGRVVNLASRVVSAAEPDEIMVTEQVADQVRNSVQLDDRGLRELKGVTGPRHLLAVIWRTEHTSSPDGWTGSGADGERSPKNRQGVDGTPA